jgi:hypothetical protein
MILKERGFTPPDFILVGAARGFVASVLYPG